MQDIRDDSPAGPATLQAAQSPSRLASISSASSPRTERQFAHIVPWLFAAATVAGHLAWPFATGETRTAFTIATVITSFMASVSHALIWRGPRWVSGYLAASVGIGWLVEAVGVATGWPFGAYHYTETLGPMLLGVPLLIPLAWAMMAYPCLLATQFLVRSSLATALLGGYLFATWDLFLDPQMVAEGHWVWHDPDWTLPGIPGIPVQNFLGWLGVSILMMAILNRLPRIQAPSAMPTAMLSWVYVSNVFAAVVFFGRPAVAVWGGICMGLVTIPWWLRLRSPRTAPALDSTPDGRGAA